jgi:hypothetical protein
VIRSSSTNEEQPKPCRVCVINAKRPAPKNAVKDLSLTKGVPEPAVGYAAIAYDCRLLLRNHCVSHSTNEALPAIVSCLWRAISDHKLSSYSAAKIPIIPEKIAFVVIAFAAYRHGFPFADFGPIALRGPQIKCNVVSPVYR